jgi:hypothetical protein
MGFNAGLRMCLILTPKLLGQRFKAKLAEMKLSRPQGGRAIVCFRKGLESSRDDAAKLWPRSGSEWSSPLGRSSITMHLKKNVNTEHARIWHGKKSYRDVSKIGGGRRKEPSWGSTFFFRRRGPRKTIETLYTEKPLTRQASRKNCELN